jgi:histone arginine demethylase JMJD6
MIFGRKEFWVFATDDNQYMYPEPPDNWRSGVTNIFNPDYQKFPLFRNVKATSFELGPGETLFIPAGTWHSARSLSLTMSVAFDQLNAKNMPAFTRDILSYRTRPLSRRIAYAAYFSVLGRVAGVIERLSLGR